MFVDVWNTRQNEAHTLHMCNILIGFAKPAMLPGTRQIPVGQEMIIFSAPQGPDPKISQRALNPPVGQEMITFSAPQGPDPKISQCALNPQFFPV